MLKQRFRERDLGWMGGSNSGSNSGSGSGSGGGAMAVPPVSILTNAHVPLVELPALVPPSFTCISSSSSPLLPVDSQSGSGSGLIPTDRPRKKLSFRDPEVTPSGRGGAGNAAGSAAGSNTSVTGSNAAVAPVELVHLKQRPFSDSMENVDLEVHLH